MLHFVHQALCRAAWLQMSTCVTLRCTRLSHKFACQIHALPKPLLQPPPSVHIQTTPVNYGTLMPWALEASECSTPTGATRLMCTVQVNKHGTYVRSGITVGPVNATMR